MIVAQVEACRVALLLRAGLARQGVTRPASVGSAKRSNRGGAALLRVLWRITGRAAYDGGRQPSERIARLRFWITLRRTGTNFVDAALALVEPGVGTNVSRLRELVNRHRQPNGAIDEKADEYDLLRGAEPYKFLWTRETRWLDRWELYPPGPGAFLHQAVSGVSRGARRLARRALRFRSGRRFRSRMCGATPLQGQGSP